MQVGKLRHGITLSGGRSFTKELETWNRDPAKLPTYKT